jgi:putative chitinase
MTDDYGSCPVDLGLTAEKVATATGAALEVAAAFLPILNDALPRYQINTTARIAAFLAQIGHESEGLHWLVEIWGPTPAQVRYEPPSPKATELGNVMPGDGLRYRGRGLLQITGRANYRTIGNALGEDFEGSPQLVAVPKWAVETACLFWQTHKLNDMADAGDFQRITETINGGLTGEAARLALYDGAMDALAAA